MRDTLQRGCDEMGIEWDAGMMERFEIFAAMLVEWNGRMNLTRITEPRDIAIRHFLDSLAPVAMPGMIPRGARCIDVGTGAGFPAIPLAIVRSDTRWTLLDSLQKRLSFCQAVIEALGLEADVRHGRAEDAARVPALREGFDIAVARAVSALPTLCEWMLPFVRVGGSMLAYRGKDAEAERATALTAIDKLGGGEAAVFPASVPFADLSHHILLVKKRTKTLERYPRKPNLPETKPLLA